MGDLHAGTPKCLTCLTLYSELVLLLCSNISKGLSKVSCM